MKKAISVALVISCLTLSACSQEELKSLSHDAQSIKNMKYTGDKKKDTRSLCSIGTIVAKSENTADSTVKRVATQTATFYAQKSKDKTVISLAKIVQQTTSTDAKIKAKAIKEMNKSCSLIK